jgi:hypothetical protein
VLSQKCGDYYCSTRYRRVSPDVIECDWVKMITNVDTGDRESIQRCPTLHLDYDAHTPRFENPGFLTVDVAEDDPGFRRDSRTRVIEDHWFKYPGPIPA